MDKLDLMKEYKRLYNPPKEPVLVEVPEFRFLMIDGKGDPNTSEEYMQAIEALYSVSYTLKFGIKKSGAGPGYSVMPLEGLWWSEDMSAFLRNDRTQWEWTAMIMQPDFVNDDLVRQALDEVAKKRELPNLSLLRLERFHEGTAAQIMHVGPYSAEGPTIAKLHDFIAAHGHRLTGRHHEIYLGDPRRSAPEKLRTVIRQPIA